MLLGAVRVAVAPLLGAGCDLANGVGSFMPPDPNSDPTGMFVAVLSARIDRPTRPLRDDLAQNRTDFDLRGARTALPSVDSAASNKRNDRCEGSSVSVKITLQLWICRNTKWSFSRSSASMLPSRVLKLEHRLLTSLRENSRRLSSFSRASISLRLAASRARSLSSKYCTYPSSCRVFSRDANNAGLGFAPRTLLRL